MDLKFLTLGDYISFYSPKIFKDLFVKPGEHLEKGFEEELDNLVNNIKTRTNDSDQVLQFSCERDLGGSPYWDISAQLQEMPSGEENNFTVMGQNIDKNKLTMKTLIILDKDSWARNKCVLNAKDLIHHILYE